MSFLKKLFGARDNDDPSALNVHELMRRLDLDESQLRNVDLDYHAFEIPKRRAGAGTRTILAPNPQLKFVQRRIHHRLLKRLRAHPCATGFEAQHSIATNAAFHERQATVLRLDVRDFFMATDGARIRRYFRAIGWNRDVATLLTRICTYDNGLPPGAPTSPRLSNLVNWSFDAAIVRRTDAAGARYTRYADDITISWTSTPTGSMIGDMISNVKYIANCHGYFIHGRRKTSVRHFYQRQTVTGLVVNDTANLPRETRRKLRAIEHRLRTRGHASLTEDQLRGWKALQTMIRAARS